MAEHRPKGSKQYILKSGQHSIPNADFDAEKDPEGKTHIILSAGDTVWLTDEQYNVFKNTGKFEAHESKPVELKPATPKA